MLNNKPDEIIDLYYSRLGMKRNRQALPKIASAKSGTLLLFGDANPYLTAARQNGRCPTYTRDTSFGNQPASNNLMLGCDPPKRATCNFFLLT